MNLQDKINIVKNTLFKMYPENKTELKYENPYQLLVAVIMSAQTTDKQVNKVNEKFFKVLKTPQDAINLGVEKIKSYIKSIGFYNNKAKNIFETSKILIEKYN
jgi:endonuclease-3